MIKKKFRPITAALSHYCFECTEYIEVGEMFYQPDWATLGGICKVCYEKRLAGEHHDSSRT